MNYQDAIAFLEGFINYENMRAGVSYDTRHFHLERFSRFLTRLGGPQRSCNCLHLAGTKGKGSTAAMLYALLTEAGFRSGLYTSPHLTGYCERVQVDGAPITEDSFARALEVVKRTVDDGGYEAERNYRTTFELLTAGALVAFQQAGVEWAVIETGLGGRLDATNVIEPELTMVTAIGYDHAELLGPSLAEIAAEKCGIVKPGKPLVLARQPEEQNGEVAAVARRICQEQDAPLHLVTEEWRVQERSVSGQGQRIDLLSVDSGEVESVELSLPGAHQADNLATARAALDVLGQNDQAFAERMFGNCSFGKCLAQLSWPGRFEIIARNPLVALDAAHCEISFKALALTLEENHGGGDCWLVLGLMEGKDPARLLAPLFALYPAAKVRVVPLPSPRTMPAAELAQALAAAFPELVVVEQKDAAAALSAAMQGARPEDAVVVCGSLYHLEPARRALAVK